MTTTLTTIETDAGREYRHDTAGLIAVASYHGAGLFEVWPMMRQGAGYDADFRLCDGLEAADYYALMLASEYVRYLGCSRDLASA